MNCSYFHSHIHLLFDENSSKAQEEAMRLHMGKCPACAAYYRSCQAALDQTTPRIALQTPASLKERTLRAAAMQAGAKPTRRTLLRPLLAAAALVALVVILIDPVQSIRAHAAEKLFRNAAIEFSQSPGLSMQINVRTEPNENFSYIDSKLPFVTHRLWSSLNGWRLEKPGRIAVNNGPQIRMWLPFAHTGWILAPGSGAIEGFQLLLNPEGLMRWEEAYVAKHKAATYHKEVGAETITLTVDAPAEGDFTNTYLLNTSVSTSDSRREYRFDRSTGRLLGLKISILIDSKEIPVIELANIDYDATISDSLFTLPADIEWIDLMRPIGSPNFSDITAEEAAQRLIGAMQEWDTTILAEGMPSYNLDLVKAKFAGARLIRTEEAFSSGDYPGVFVPCEITLPDGSMIRIILALRNDNKARAWVVDGGI